MELKCRPASAGFVKNELKKVQNVVSLLSAAVYKRRLRRVWGRYVSPLIVRGSTQGSNNETELV